MVAVLIAIGAVAFVAMYKWYQKAYYIPPVLLKLPGPSRLPFLGSVHHFADSTNYSWVGLHKKYGDVLFAKLFSTNIISICDPALIQKAVQMRDVLQRKTFFEYDLTLLGRVLFGIDGEEWRVRRTTLNPHFKTQNINALFSVVAERSVRAIKYLSKSNNNEINVDTVFSSVTLDVITYFLLSTHLDAASGDDNLMTTAFHNINAEALGMMLFPPWYYLPRPGKFKYLISHRKLMKFLDSVIEERRKEIPTDPQNIVDVLVANKLDNQAIKDELIGLIFAGHDTTSHTLSFALYHISNNKQIFEKVMAEINSLTFNNKGEIAKLEEVSGMKYLTACIKETLRIYPQATIHPLTALEDTSIGDIEIPKNTVVMCNTYVVQRLERYWDEPDVFKPERFVANDVAIVDGIAAHEAQAKGCPLDMKEEKIEEKQEAKKEERKGAIYFPFLQGRHMCIGQHLAMLEMRVVLATFLKYYDFSVKPGYVPKPTVGLAFPPDGGLWLTPIRKVNVE